MNADCVNSQILKWAEAMALLVECVPNIYKAFGSIPSIAFRYGCIAVAQHPAGRSRGSRNPKLPSAM